MFEREWEIIYGYHNIDHNFPTHFVSTCKYTYFCACKHTGIILYIWSAAVYLRIYVLKYNWKIYSFINRVTLISIA